jgi:BirA family biotin operon repressor/biotin-[acetyl-CoA-carboxylase] ligase
MNADEHMPAWEWEPLGEVDSTNRLALARVLERWARHESANRLAVIARRQTAGRGQHGRAWESPDGGVYLSLVIEDVPQEWRARLALVMGLVLVEALENTVGLRIRWPNDVLLNGKKVAGILCEAASQGEQWVAVIGIGVNVESMNFSPELRGIATSLHAEGLPLSKTGIAQAIANQWDRLAQQRPTLRTIVQRVQKLDALLGQRVRLDDGEKTWEGVGAGIADDGSLLIRLTGGAVKPFARGTVAIL